MPKHTHLRRCTAESKGHRFCDRLSIPDAPFPICSRHALAIFRHMADALDSADPVLRLVAGFEEMDDARAKRYRGERRTGTDASVVYYLLIDGLVKIGYAADLERRLVAYPPTAKVLATEPGGREVESIRLAEFADYKSAGREWFTPGPRLRAHIEGLADYRAA
jgi:hypothetical protein